MKKPENYEDVLKDLLENALPEIARLVTALQAQDDQFMEIDFRLRPDVAETLLFFIEDLQDRNNRMLNLLVKLEPALVRASTREKATTSFLRRAAKLYVQTGYKACSHIAEEATELLKTYEYGD